MRHRSPKTARRYTERRKLVAQILEARPVCERCRSAPSTDVHELKTRARGGSILDPGNCVALCRTCHTHVHDTNDESWLVHSWEG